MTEEDCPDMIGDLIKETQRLREELEDWDRNGTTAHGWLNEVRPRPGADEGPDALRLRVESCVKLVACLRSELAEQKAANLALAERLAAERGKVCGCQQLPEDNK